MKKSSERRTHWTSLLILSLAALTVLACVTHGAAAQGEGDAEGLRVTVLIYSGRPNPSFLLQDGAEIEGLRKALTSAEAREDFPGETVVPSILGYNGLRIDNPAGEEGLPRTLLLYDGTMEVRDRGRRFVADAGRQLERSLIDLAVERGLFAEDERALAIIRESLGGSTDQVY